MKVSSLIYKYTQNQMHKEINHKLDKHVSSDSFDIELPNIVEEQLNNPNTDEPEVEAD